MQIFVSRHKLNEQHDAQRYSIHCHGFEVGPKGGLEPAADAATFIFTLTAAAAAAVVAVAIVYFHVVARKRVASND